MALEWYGEQVRLAAEAAAIKGLDRLAGEIAQDARESMDYDGKGRDYTRKNGRGQRRFYKRSSAPYDPPVKQTGALQRSVQVEPRGRFVRAVGTNEAVGLYLELGTRKMDPRPWLRPALYKFTGRTGEELWEGLLK